LGSGAEVDAGAQFLEVYDVALPHAHAGPSVEPGGACDALGVHAEENLPDAAAVVQATMSAATSSASSRRGALVAYPSGSFVMATNLAWRRGSPFWGAPR